MDDKMEEHFENYLSKIIVDCCYQIHVGLGPGLLESSYESCLLYELHQAGITAESQVLLAINYKDISIVVQMS